MGLHFCVFCRDIFTGRKTTSVKKMEDPADYAYLEQITDRIDEVIAEIPTDLGSVGSNFTYKYRGLDYEDLKHTIETLNSHPGWLRVGETRMAYPLTIDGLVIESSKKRCPVTVGILEKIMVELNTPLTVGFAMMAPNSGIEEHTDDDIIDSTSVSVNIGLIGKNSNLLLDMDNGQSLAHWHSKGSVAVFRSSEIRHHAHNNDKKGARVILYMEVPRAIKKK